MEIRRHPTALIGDRCTGKSTALLRMALKEHGNIATFNRMSCKVFASIAEEVLNIPIDKIQNLENGWYLIDDVLVAPFSAYMNHPTGSYMNPTRPLFIDELEYCLRDLLYRNQTVGGFTMSIG